MFLEALARKNKADTTEMVFSMLAQELLNEYTNWLFWKRSYFKKLDQTWDDIEIKEKDMIDLTKNRGAVYKVFFRPDSMQIKKSVKT